MERSSRDTPTSSSPDQLHPSQVDDSDWSDESIVRARTYALAALVVGAPLLVGGLLFIVIAEHWRAWRGRVNGSR